MELVPFIYTVLKIAALSAIITLIVSYISFRNKLKNGTLDLPTEKNTQKKNAQSTILQVNQIQKKDEPSSQPLVRKASAKAELKPKSAPKHEAPKGKSGQRKRKPDKGNHSKRLQIIKELQPSGRKKDHMKEAPHAVPKTNELLSSLDEDIISKYGENDENGFHVLNVKDQKDKSTK